MLADVGVFQSLRAEYTDIYKRNGKPFPFGDIGERIGVAAHIEEELVGEHVDGELLVAEGVDARRATAGRRPDLERDRPHRLAHADQQPDEVLVRRRLGQELLLPPAHTARSAWHGTMTERCAATYTADAHAHAPGCPRSRSGR
jgi:hypothetical protein